MSILLLTLQMASGQTSVTIFYTNNINGYFENCLCSDHPLGSLEKMKPLLDSARAGNEHILFLDGGDLFSPFADIERDRAMYRIAALMHYDAIAIGDQEFSNGIDFFLDQQEQFRLPFLCANLSLSGQKPFQPFLTRTFGTLNILITAVIHPQAFNHYPEEITRHLEWQDYFKSAEETIRSNPADFIIVLSHAGSDVDKQLARSVKGIDLILGAHTQELFTEPLKVENTWISQTGSDGYYLGKLVFDFDARKTAHLKRAEMIPMHLDLANDTTLVRLIKEYHHPINQNVIRKNPLPAPVASPYQVSPVQSCSTCHADFYRDWRSSKHAAAFETLQREGKTRLLKCISCHVSGFGRMDGFFNINLTGELAGVACTECHYVTPQHSTNPDAHRPGEIRAQTCTRCHDRQNDPGFNFEEDRLKIMHRIKVE